MTLKERIKSTRALAIASRVGAEQLARARDRVGRRDRLMGATHRDLDLLGSLAYIDAVHDDYLTYAGLRPEELEGKRVLEIGPGDNLGVALRFAALGADVVAIDRFHTWRDPAQQARIHLAVRDRMTADQSRRLGSLLSEDGELDLATDRLGLIEGVPIEDAPARLGGQRFDLIVSRAVLEHVLDLDGAFAAMDQLLRSGGLLSHKVDIRDHGLFTDGGQHPLTFLTVSDRTYTLMGAEAGLPNRQLMGDYRRRLDALGYESEYLLTHLIDRPDELEPATESPDAGRLADAEARAEQIRARLLPRFRDRPARDLAVSGVFVIARKPAA
jgi:SAM-dependent methyltransferase